MCQCSDEEIMLVNELNLRDRRNFPEQVCKPVSSQIKPSLGQNTKCGYPDTRAINEADISTMVYDNKNLKNVEKNQLFALLLRYMPFFTSKPGKCKSFEY